MTNEIDSGIAFPFPPPSIHQALKSLPSPSSFNPSYDPKPRKKRSKLIKLGVGELSASSSAISRPKITKKPDPLAPKITRPCSECGKKFWSWKALFGHMRCHPERQWRGINPPPNYRRPSATSPVSHVKPDVETSLTEEDHEVASCLLMLSNTEVSSERNYQQLGVEENESRFECSSCKKVFGSHQALGGHRASHKNVKGCFAITRSDVGDESVEDDERGKDLVLWGHKCSVCLRVFSSGQALGGHKRCHWERTEEASASASPSRAIQGGGLDLNLPAPTQDDSFNSDSYSSFLALDLRLGL